MNYAVGANLPGYLPEGDVWITPDFESARTALIDDLERTADHLGREADLEPHTGGDDDALKACEEAITELREAEAGSFLVYVDGVAYWIDETTEEPTQD